MKKLIAVIGLDSFGLAICKTLSSLKKEALAIDINTTLVEELANDLEHIVIADATHINALKDLGIEKYDHVIVAIPNKLETSIMILMNLKELGVKKITMRIDEPKYRSIFERLGADEIIIPEQDSAISFANKLINESFIEYYQVEKGFAIVKIKVPKSFKIQTLMDLDSRNKYDVNIISIIKDGVFSIPKGLDMIEPNDVLVVIGVTKNLSRFEKFLNNTKK